MTDFGQVDGSAGVPVGEGAGQPRVSYTGPVAVWWIPKPRGPKLSFWATLRAWVIAIPVLTATMLWVHSEARPLWPFGRSVTSPAEILLRYEIVLLVCLVYISLCSLPLWWRHYRWAKRDAGAIEEAIRSQSWETAALLVHRYCLLLSTLKRRAPARVRTWDDVLRPKLSRHRRLYVYYRGIAPPMPRDATAGFTPEVIPPPRPSLWSAAALIPIAILLYQLAIDVMRKGYPQRLVLFNAVLLIVILTTYGSYFAMAILGRSRYFRFAPGVAQLVKFGLGRRRPGIVTFDLRQSHAALDVTSKFPALTLVDTPGHQREALRLPRGNEVIEAVMRACLSTSPSPPLSEEELVE